ncbi:MAG: chaperone NapD [Rhodospirillales bacterium]|jgi:periplasmic nitrate reductase NapD|nr:chaperone NapD [Rhodospirillales bacterium]
MSISSLVVHAQPETAPQVVAVLAAQTGVEVHGTSEDGQIVVTVDQPDDGAAVETIEGFRNIQNVLSVSLVYSHFEENAAGEEQTDESIKA